LESTKGIEIKLGTYIDEKLVFFVMYWCTSGV